MWLDTTVIIAPIVTNIYHGKLPLIQGWKGLYNYNKKIHCYLDISYWHVFHPLHQRSEVNSTGLPNSFGTPLYCAASVWFQWPSLARDNILGLSFFEITILVPLGINCSMLHSSHYYMGGIFWKLADPTVFHFSIPWLQRVLHRFLRPLPLLV